MQQVQAYKTFKGSWRSHPVWFISCHAQNTPIIKRLKTTALILTGFDTDQALNHHFTLLPLGQR